MPTGGWTGTVNDSGAGGAQTFTVAAGTYYLSTRGSASKGLVGALQDALNSAATTDDLTVTLANGENGTGKVTITSTGSTAIVWTSADLKLVLGFDTDLAAGTTWTGANQCRQLWLPNRAYWAPNTTSPDWSGWIESDFRAVENAAGYVVGFKGQDKTVNHLLWSSIPRHKVWVAHETVVNESWERFYKDAIWGDGVGGTPTGPIRFYPDSDISATCVTYSVPLAAMIKPEPVVESWAAGPWKLELERLVVTPGTEAVVGIDTDGPDSVYVPSLASDYEALGLPGPGWIWPLQETSGDVVDIIAGLHLSASATPSYQNTVTGWTRKFVGFTDGTASQRFSTTSTDVAPLTASYAILIYASINSVTAARRLTHQASLSWTMDVSSAGLVGARFNGTTGNGSSNHNGLTTVRPYLFGRNTSNSTARMFTTLEQVNCTYSGTSLGSGGSTNFALGTSGSTVPDARIGYCALWIGTDADTILAKTTLSTLGWTLAY